jgi:gas vesicle structural protein
MVAHLGSGHSVADDVLTDPILRRGPGYPSAGGGDLVASPRRDPQIRRAPSGTGLYDVLDLILDKGIVIDAFVRVSLVGIELLTVDLRVVIASVDTYLRYAEGAERLQLYQPRGGEDQLPDMMGMDKKSGGIGGQMLKQGTKKLKSKLIGGGGDDDEKDDDEDEGVGEKLAHGVRHVLTGGVGRVMERLSGKDRDDSRDPVRSNGKHGRRDKSAKRHRARAGR